MSNNNLNTKQTKKRLETQPLVGSINVYISDEILDKIKFLCRAISREEWSGILFYTVEGTMKRPEEAKFIIKDILLMDHGSGAYTEYNWDESLVEYQMNHPESIEEDWIKGHIHSHNSMGVFFSDTDTDELKDNVSNHNIYLSIIVNNFMDFDGRLVFTMTPSHFVCLDEKGREYNLKLSDVEPIMAIMEVKFHMNISVPEEFKQRLVVIEEAHKRETEKRKDQWKTQDYGKSNNPSSYPNGYNDYGNRGNYGNHGTHKKNQNQKALPTPKNLGRIPGDYSSSSFQQGELSEETLNHVMSLQEEFLCFVLRLGNTNVVDDVDVEDTLTWIDTANLEPNFLAESITEKFEQLYDRFFVKHKGQGYETTSKFLDIMFYVVDTLEEYEPEFPFLSPIVVKLKEKGQNLEITLNNSENHLTV